MRPVGPGMERSDVPVTANRHRVVTVRLAPRRWRYPGRAPLQNRGGARYRGAATLSHTLPVMADNSSGNTASVAIVVLVILAIAAAVWFFTQGGGAGAGAPDKVDVNISAPGDGGSN